MEGLSSQEAQNLLKEPGYNTAKFETIVKAAEEAKWP